MAMVAMLIVLVHAGCAAAEPAQVGHDALDSRHFGSSEHLPPLPQYTTGPPGAHFAGVFTESATDGDAAAGVVLQRAPQAAAVYGVVLPTTGKTGDTVTVAVAEASAREAPYSVTADVLPDGSWKALLKPAPAGGSYTISAACKTCGSTKPDTLVNATFGDVWFCSGQSNMWLVMHFQLERNATYAKVREGKYDNIRMRTTTNAPGLTGKVQSASLLPETSPLGSPRSQLLTPPPRLHKRGKSCS